uniref:DNA-directed RNA polymerase n=1 Tax=Callipsygma wilsonis TaxID=2320807 RepID=A0A386AZV4_9CHLO|nr:RNA polymerase b-subunit [Callipsygma wilsonis]AYC64975.1 RNA polymerase b-subunit [Callipsygma wilsonis]
MLLFMKKTIFFNHCFDKNRFYNFLRWFLKKNKKAELCNFLEKLKSLGFHFSTKSGFSIGIEDLKIPSSKSTVLFETESVVFEISLKFLKGDLTNIEHYQQVIELWNRTSEILKNQVFQSFKLSDVLNPVYLMSFSGARGNVSQIKQLVGMRGLMADALGQIIDFPIRSNFREGLTLTEYLISCSGARKGVVDTALRTASSGYLTRRLVDVAHNVIVSQVDCGSNNSVFIKELYDKKKKVLSLNKRILGRVLAETIIIPESKICIGKKNQEISEILSLRISKSINKVRIRSPLTCKSSSFICQFCYGWNLSEGKLVSIGEAVGVIAAQSIGEPGTQLTMRTFHTGGIFTGTLLDQTYSPISGKTSYPSAYNGLLIRTKQGKIAYLSRNGGVLRISSFKIIFSHLTILYIKHGEFVKQKQLIAESHQDISNTVAQEHKIYSPVFGEIIFDKMTKNFNKFLILYGQSTFYSIFFKQYDFILGLMPVSQFNIGFLKSEKSKLRVFFKKTSFGKTNNRNEVSYLYTIYLLLKSSFFVEFPRNKISYFQENLWILSLNKQGNFLQKFLPNQSFLKPNQSFLKNLSNKYILSPRKKIIHWYNIFNQKYVSFFYLVDLNFFFYHGIKNEQIFGFFTYIRSFLYNEKKFRKKKEKKEKNTIFSFFFFQGFFFIIKKKKRLYLINIFDKKKRFLKKKKRLYLINILNKKKRFLDKIKRFLKKRERFLDKKKRLYLINILKKIKRLSNKEKRLSNKEKRLLNKREKLLGEKKRFYFLKEKWFFIGNSKSLFPIKKNIFNRYFFLFKKLNIIKNYKIRFLIYKLKKPIFCYLSFLDFKPSIKIIQRNFENYETHYFYNHYYPNKLPKCLSNTKIIKKNLPKSFEKIILFRFFLNFSKINEITSINNDIILTTVRESYFISDQYYLKDQFVAKIGKKFLFRKTKIYFLNDQSFLYIKHGDIITNHKHLWSMFFTQSKTGDIVQGITKIEEIFEIRRRQKKFEYFQSLQKSIVNNIQKVYCSQGIFIADKHIEIIIRQMTSSAIIINQGDTDLLPGEIISLQWISMMLKSNINVVYQPLLLGITKTCIETSSFISAASFQETIRVLGRAAVLNRMDFLRGLKQNVILGNFIPVGTSFF